MYWQYSTVYAVTGSRQIVNVSINTVFCGNFCVECFCERVLFIHSYSLSACCQRCSERSSFTCILSVYMHFQKLQCIQLIVYLIIVFSKQHLSAGRGATIKIMMPSLSNSSTGGGLCRHCRVHREAGWSEVAESLSAPHRAAFLFNVGRIDRVCCWQVIHEEDWSPIGHILARQVLTALCYWC